MPRGASGGGGSRVICPNTQAASSSPVRWRSESMTCVPSLSRSPWQLPRSRYGAPTAPPRTRSRIRASWGSVRRWWLMISWAPCSWQAATIARASPRLVAIGFSQQRPRTPACAAAMVSSAWLELGVAIASKSGRSAARSSSKRVNTRTPVKSAAASLATASSRSQIAASSTPSAAWSARQCPRPIPRQPTTAAVNGSGFMGSPSAASRWPSGSILS